MENAAANVKGIVRKAKRAIIKDTYTARKSEVDRRVPKDARAADRVCA